MAHSDDAEPERTGMTSVASLFRAEGTEQRRCEKHGEYTSNLFVLPGPEGRRMWTPCPACERVRIEAEDRERVAATLESNRRVQLERMIGRAAIPKRFSGCTFENYRTEEPGPAKALGKARRYAESFPEIRERGTSLIFCGNVGNGKTHLAVAIIRAIMETGYSGMYARVIELARAVNETYSPDSTRTERDVYETFAQPDLLVIDEVGRQRNSDAERLVLYEVINRRSEDMKPTLLSTNLSLTGLREYLDEAAEDRLREGGGTVVIFDWKSYRGN